ncbi:MAG TPA: Hsp20/alpha crystallin family protein, partial [Cyclobacteriaceae bacterium]
MSIVRYNSNEFVPASFSSLVDRFFNDSIARSGGSTFVPKVDIIENSDSYEIHFAAPGLSKEDFKIEVNDNHLIVSGERKFTNEKKEKSYHS